MPAAQSKAILVADDDSLVLEVLKSRLGREGYRIHAAADGEAALDLAARARPDLVILDAMMPVHDGFTVLRELKANAALARIPVIMLSARRQDADKSTAFELGAVDYIVKPFSPDDLILRIRQLVG
jgi:DNA-binding response OmpR family regulator